jgi:ribonuclease VapC
VILDTSAIVAVILGEAARDELLESMDAAMSRAAGTPTLVEAAIVLQRRGLDGKGLVRHFLRDADVEEVELTSAHWPVAADAYRLSAAGVSPLSSISVTA